MKIKYAFILLFHVAFFSLFGAETEGCKPDPDSARYCRLIIDRDEEGYLPLHRAMIVELPGATAKIMLEILPEVFRDDFEINPVDRATILAAMQAAEPSGGLSPLHLAYVHGKGKWLKKLLRFVLRIGGFEICERLIELKNHSGRTIVHMAIQEGDEEMVRWLLEKMTSDEKRIELLNIRIATPDKRCKAWDLAGFLSDEEERKSMRALIRGYTGKRAGHINNILTT